MALCLHIKPNESIRSEQIIITNKGRVGVRLFIDAPLEMHIDRCKSFQTNSAPEITLVNSSKVQIGPMVVGNRNLYAARLAISAPKDMLIRLLS